MKNILKLVALMVVFAFIVTAIAGCTEEEKKTKPIANAGEDKTMTIGEQVVFVGSDSKGKELNFTWDFGDNTTGYGEVIEHVYASSGIFTVTLTVKDKWKQTADIPVQRFDIRAWQQARVKVQVRKVYLYDATDLIQLYHPTIERTDLFADETTHM